MERRGRPQGKKSEVRGLVTSEIRVLPEGNDEAGAEDRLERRRGRRRVRGGRKPEWRRGKMKRKGEGRGKKKGNVWVIEAGRECPATGREYYSLLRLCSINRYSDGDEGTYRRGRVVGNV